MKRLGQKDLEDISKEAAFEIACPGWVQDEDIWDKAEKAVDKKKYSGDSYWAVVTTVYKNMGGKIKGKKEKRSGIEIAPTEIEDIKVFLAEYPQEFDDWYWDGEELVVLRGSDVVNRHSRDELITLGVVKTSKEKKKKVDKRYQNPDGTFKKMTPSGDPSGKKNKFNGAVRYFMESEGLGLEDAKEMAGWIKNKKG